MGALNSVATSLGGNYITATLYNPEGTVKSQAIGNGVTTLYDYYTNNLRLKTAVSAKIPQSPLLNLAYQYDAIGNIKEITQSSTNKLEVLTYGYDSLDRLNSVLATDTLNTVYQRTYSYDEIGNIITVGKWPGAPANNNSASVGSASVAADNRGRITSFTGGNAYSSFTEGKLGPAPISNLTMGRGSVASGAISSNSSRGSICHPSGYTDRVALGKLIRSASAS